MAVKLRLRRGFLKHLTPAKKEQGEIVQHRDTRRYLEEQPDAAMKVTGHTVLGFLFYAAFLIYVIFSVVDYVTAPKPSTMGMTPAQQISVPVRLNVTATCMWGNCGSIFVIENYTNYPYSPCAVAIPSRYRSTAIPSGSSAIVNLCYTGEESRTVSSSIAPVPVSMVQVLFTMMLPASFANVTVVSIGDGGAAINRQLGLEPSVFRVFTLGGTLSTMDGSMESFTPYGLTYETEADLTVTLSTIWLRLNPVVNWNKRTSGPTVVDLLASFGNALESLERIFIVLVPLALCIFAVESSEQQLDESPVPPTASPIVTHA